MGFPTKNDHFGVEIGGTPIFGNTHLFLQFRNHIGKLTHAGVGWYELPPGYFANTRSELSTGQLNIDSMYDSK